MPTREIWKTIPSQPKYQASSHGRIRNAKNRQTKSQTQSNGRNYVTISFKRLRVASLVAEAFIGPRPDGLQVEHIDQDKANDRAGNLTYVKPSENIRRSYLLSKRNRTRGCSRLDKESVRLVRSLLATGDYTQVAISKMLGISNSTVNRIANKSFVLKFNGKRKLLPPTPEMLEKFKKPKRHDWDRIVELRGQGLTLRQVAAEVGCSVHHVQGVLHKSN